MREYRYEIRTVIEELQVGMYVEYRPAATQGEPDEMRLTVARVGNEYTLTLYDQGEVAASKTYGKYVESAPAVQDAGAPERVEDFSTVEGLILSLSEADFLPELAIPDGKPVLNRSAEQWVIKAVPLSDYTEVNLFLYTNDWAQELTLPLTYDEKQQAYVCAPTQEAITLANMENTRIELHLILPLPGHEGETYQQEYRFWHESWRVLASVQHGGYDYSIIDGSSGYCTVYCWDDQDNPRWYATYDDDGKAFEVSARPDTIPSHAE